jgi:hypothetical protein
MQSRHNLARQICTTDYNIHMDNVRDVSLIPALSSQSFEVCSHDPGL